MKTLTIKSKIQVLDEIAVSYVSPLSQTPFFEVIGMVKTEEIGVNSVINMVERAMEEYAAQQLSALQQENEILKKGLEGYAAQIEEAFGNENKRLQQENEKLREQQYLCSNAFKIIRLLSDHPATTKDLEKIFNTCNVALEQIQP